MTWIRILKCDRCGQTKEGPYTNDRPDDWSYRLGCDLCPECWEIYAEKQRQCDKLLNDFARGVGFSLEEEA